MAGWIKLHRKTLESQVYSDAELFRLWCYLLLRASFKTSWFRGVEIRRGQVAFSYRVLSDALGYSRGKLERSMKKLEAMGSIHIKAGREFSVATVCNYESYQSDEDPMRDAGEAADRAVDKTAAGAADKAVNGAVYKKEIIQEPPPPTPSAAATPDRSAWEGVGDVLAGLGMTKAPDAVATAQARGLAVSEVQGLIAEWRQHEGAWGTGALYQRLTGQLAAWPPVAPAFERQQQWQAAVRGHDANAARRLEGDRRREADRQRYDQLNDRHGASIDAMTRDEVLAQLGADSPLIDQYRSRGVESRLVREALFAAIESTEAVA